MKLDKVMALAEDALAKNDSKTLFQMLKQSHKDIEALIRLQGIYAGMDGKAAPSGDMETVKIIAMEAMSMAKMILQDRLVVSTQKDGVV